MPFLMLHTLFPNKDFFSGCRGEMFAACWCSSCMFSNAPSCLCTAWRRAKSRWVWRCESRVLLKCLWAGHQQQGKPACALAQKSLMLPLTVMHGLCVFLYKRGLCCSFDLHGWWPKICRASEQTLNQKYYVVCFMLHNWLNLTLADLDIYFSKYSCWGCFSF